MVRSMTGFGRAKETVDGLNITAEIKSVNHRYFEFTSRLPRTYMFVEDRIKEICRESITRGKVEVFIQIEDNRENAVTVEANEDYARAYIGAVKQLCGKLHLKNDVKASSLLTVNDIFKIKQNSADDDVVLNAVETVFKKAVAEFVKMREKEGQRLFDDVKARADVILGMVGGIEKKSPDTVKQYRQRIEEKIKELLGDVKVDEQRLLTETAIFADKVAVDEETVRLRSHISQLCGLISEGGAVGRKLDFIVQEMNREANTIGSKAQDIEIAHIVVDIKSEIEKIREQIQNIE